MNFKSSDEEVGGDMLALQLKSEETDEVEDVEEDGMVAIAVLIDEELLTRIETSVHSNLGTECINDDEVGKEGLPKKLPE